MSPLVMETTLVATDWHALSMHLQRRIARDGWHLTAFAAWVGAVVIGSALLTLALATIGSEIDPLTVFLVALLCIVVSAAMQPWYRRLYQPDASGTILGLTRYELDASGILTSRDNNSSFVHWRAVRAVEETADHVFLIVDRMSGIILPKRNLPADLMPSLNNWAGERGGCGNPEVIPAQPGWPAPRVAADAPRSASSSFLQLVLRNLRNGLYLFLLRRVRPSAFTRAFDQIAALGLLTFATAAGVDWLLAAPDSDFNSYALVNWMSVLGVVVLTTFLIARAQSLQPDVLALLTPLLAVAPFVIATLGVVARFTDLDQEDYILPLVGLMLVVLYGSLVLRAAYEPVDIATRVVTVIVLLTTFVVSSGFSYLGSSLWHEPFDVEHFMSERADSERLMFEQSARIDTAVQSMTPAIPGQEDVFFVGFAGHGFQGVFRREALFAERVFAERYGSASRSVELVNDDEDLETYPLATVSGLRHALKGIGARMNRDEDVLILMLTSHGSSDGELSVSNSAMMLSQLDAQAVRSALDDAGIKWRIVVVSACYAGTFIEPLKTPGTLVVTAADAEHNSFGCADERDLTYFGEAFLRDALPGASNLPEAYRKASELIRTREAAEGKTHSNPQMFIGEEMARKLTALEAARTSAGTTRP
jgi:hypothetical protein